jgi:hypothetical protein
MINVKNRSISIAVLNNDVHQSAIEPLEVMYGGIEHGPQFSQKKETEVFVFASL